MKGVVVTGSFDDLRSRHVRFLEEASKQGEVHALLFPDEAVWAVEGKAPRFPLEERLYMLQAVRYVSRVSVVSGDVERDALSFISGIEPDMWVVDEASDNYSKRVFCASFGVGYHVVKRDDLDGFPYTLDNTLEETPVRKRVLVTGCFDWFHSGHIRFFEEVSQLGDLYVVVGHDQNIRLLKGKGHPLFSQEERRYMVQSVRYVKRALISSGLGWLDAEPEIEMIRPHIYAVNQDGDVPEKRQYCERHSIEYVVLKRTPREGLPKRESTELRGF